MLMAVFTERVGLSEFTEIKDMTNCRMKKSKAITIPIFALVRKT
jgi:hypothetical protein